MLLRHVRESEVLASMRGLFEQYRTKSGSDTGAPIRTEGTKSVPVDIERWFRDLTVNVVFGMIIGRRFNDEQEGAEKGRHAGHEGLLQTCGEVRGA